MKLSLVLTAAPMSTYSCFVNDTRSFYFKLCDIFSDHCLNLNVQHSLFNIISKADSTDPSVTSLWIHYLLSGNRCWKNPTNVDMAKPLEYLKFSCLEIPESPAPAECRYGSASCPFSAGKSCGVVERSQSGSNPGQAPKCVMTKFFDKWQRSRVTFYSEWLWERVHSPS